jgi:chemotaxis protein MotB
LAKGLDSELKNGKLQLKLEARGLVISMREATFFGSGNDTISPACMPILTRIAEVVRQMPNPVRLEGHTDSRPIHNSRFRNNWELSAARSIAMLEILHDRFDVPQSRMAVAGYAENAPADTNDSEEGRGHNRRVDLVLLSPGALSSEPATPAVSVITPAMTVTDK